MYTAPGGNVCLLLFRKQLRNKPSFHLNKQIEAQFELMSKNLKEKWLFDASLAVTIVTQ